MMETNKLISKVFELRTGISNSALRQRAKIISTYKAIAAKSIENLIKANPENNYFAHCLLLPGGDSQKYRFEIAKELENSGFDCTVNNDSIYVVLKIK